MGRLTSINYEEAHTTIDNVKYWMDVYTKLKKYEEIIDEPEKLQLIDEMYLEKCQEINALKEKISMKKVRAIFNGK